MFLSTPPGVKVYFNRKNKLDKLGRGNVEIRIRFSRNENKYIPLGKITPEEWETDTHTNEIAKQVQKYTKIIDSMVVRGIEMTRENFEAQVGEGTSTTKKHTKCMVKARIDGSFLDYMFDEIGKEVLKQTTKNQQYVAHRALEDSGIIESFRDLTVSNIIAFDQYLHKLGDKKLSTIYGYHKRIHHYVTKAYIEGIIPTDPYKQVKFKHGEHGERTRLTEDEFNMIISAKLNKTASKVRDLFVFAASTGLAYVDAMDFAFEDNVTLDGDLYFITGRRVKTGTEFYTPILPPGLEVLRRYKFHLPRISNQKCNDYLHAIEVCLGLNKPITFHVARHTFATILLNRGIPIETIAKMLGHKNIRTTAIYAKLFKSTVAEQAKKVSSALFPGTTIKPIKNEGGLKKDANPKVADLVTHTPPKTNKRGRPRRATVSVVDAISREFTRATDAPKRVKDMSRLPKVLPDDEVKTEKDMEETETPKHKPGRLRKNTNAIVENAPAQPKAKRGRPKKNQEIA